jgi:EmrB/QacA subfamily drug resistance transporter
MTQSAAFDTADPIATPSEVEPVDPTRLTPRLRAILAVVLIADILDLMDATITNIAAPSIARDLGGGESLIKWLGAAYSLAIGVLLVLGGRLGDRYGKRRIFLIGITGFTAASAVCGLSIDPTMIIVGRLVQGGFGALMIPQGISILMATFTRAQLPRAVSAFGPAMGVSAVLGPIVAGFIISANVAGLDWRPVFLINIVLGLIGLVAAIKLLPRDQPVSHEPIDAVGAALLGATMLTFIFGLIEGSTSGWTALPVISLAGGVLLFAGFAVRQRQTPNPLITPSLLKNRGFTSGLVLGLGFFAAVSGLAYVISLFFQLVLHLSPSRAALGLAPVMVGIIAASIVCRPLLTSFGRRLVVAGLVVTLLGALGLWLTVLAKGTSLTPWITAPSLLVLGVGMGACFSTIYDVALGDVTQEEAGSASGSLSAVQQLAAAIGSATVTTVFFAVLRASGGARAMTVSVLVVVVVILLCLGLVWLLPRAAPADELGSDLTRDGLSGPHVGDDQGADGSAGPGASEPVRM